MTPAIKETLRVAAERGTPGDPNEVFRRASRQAQRRRRVLQVGAVALVLVAVGGAAFGLQARDGRTQRVAASSPEPQSCGWGGRAFSVSPAMGVEGKSTPAAAAADFARRNPSMAGFALPLGPWSSVGEAGIGKDVRSGDVVLHAEPGSNTGWLITAGRQCTGNGLAQERPDVDLGTGMNVWPADNIDSDRSSAEAVASAFVAAITNESPLEVVARPMPTTAVGPGPTYVDVRVRGGASIEVFTAPEGDTGWRILQVGKTGPSQPPNGAITPDVVSGPVVVGSPSPIRVKFGAPSGTSTATVFYSTQEGTFSVELDAGAVASGEVVLPRTESSANSTGVGSLAIVYRSSDGFVIDIRAHAGGLGEQRTPPRTP